MVTSWESLFGTLLELLCLAIFAGWIFSYHKRRDKRPLAFSDVLELLKRVDVTAVSRLFDPMEEARLRKTLPRTEFGKMQAKRLAEARNQFRQIVANARLLQILGYRYLHQTDEPDHKPPHRRSSRQKGQYRDDAGRAMAQWMIDVAVTVKMPGRAGLFVLFLWARLNILERILLSPNLADLKDVVSQTLEAYEDLKEAALILARHSEPGIELPLSCRL